MAKDLKEYAIGYKKPPVSTRFKPGQSGNPSGSARRKGRTLLELVEHELEHKIAINGGMKQQTLPAIQLIIRGQVHKALKGDTRAFESLMKSMNRDDSARGDTLAPLLDSMKAMHARHEAATRSVLPEIETQPKDQEANILAEEVKREP